MHNVQQKPVKQEARCRARIAVTSRDNRRDRFAERAKSRSKSSKSSRNIAWPIYLDGARNHACIRSYNATIQQKGSASLEQICSHPKQISSHALVNNKSGILIKTETANLKAYYGTRSLVLLLLSGIILQYAHLCVGLGLSERDHNPDLAGFAFNPQSNPQHTSSIISPWNMISTNQQSSTLAPLSFRHVLNQFMGHDVSQTVPSAMDSFTRETSEPALVPDINPSSQDALSSVTSDGSVDTLDTHIKNILVPRVSGTPGNIKVRQYIVDALKANDYHVELDESTQSTPVGQVKFVNIIASSNPRACRQLVLACHYDSKMMDGFLGASDSAVPCAMLLRISETFSKSFRPDDSQSDTNELGLQFIFFDGEEAYVQWSPSDSLYGSRHLAEKWEKQLAPAQCRANNPKMNELKRIELLMVLDLIGPSDTSFVMYNRDLKRHYDNMVSYEREHLASMGLQARRAAAFRNRYVPLQFIDDDHVPFMRRGVPILSLLASPFPSVWHTVNDNYQAIDFPKTRRILHVLTRFVANYSKN